MRHAYNETNSHQKSFPLRRMFPFMILFLFAMSRLYQVPLNYLIFIVVIWFVLKGNHHSNRSKYRRMEYYQSEKNTNVSYSVPVAFSETLTNTDDQLIKSLFCYNCGSGMTSAEIYCSECGSKVL